MGIPATLSSVPAQTPYIQYVATSGQTVFPYPFEITQDSDLVAVANGTTLATDSGYTLSGVGNATGGNLTFTSGRTVGDIITLYRDIPIERLTQIAQNGGFSSTAFNAEFNNIYLLLQQLQQNLDQCLQIPNTNNPTPTVSLTPGAYANKYLAFDSNGNPEPALLTANGTVTQSSIAALLWPQTSAESGESVSPTTLTPPATINLIRYGADPTGVNPSDAALSDAVAVCTFLGGGTIYAPAGVYKFASQISLAAKSSIVIQGDGAATGGVNPATVFKYTGTGTSYWINMNSAVGCQIRGIQLEHTSSSFTGTYIQCNNDGTHGDPTFCGLFDCVLGSNVSNTTHLNLNKCIEFTAERCNFIYGNPSVLGMATGGYSNVIRFRDCSWESSAAAPVQGGGESWLFSGCTFEPLASGAAGAILSTSSSTYFEGLVIEACWFGDATATAGTWIDVYASGFSFTGNQMGGTQTASTGIVLRQASGVSIIGNSINSLLNGISFAVANCIDILVQGNVFNSVTNVFVNANNVPVGSFVWGPNFGVGSPPSSNHGQNGTNGYEVNAASGRIRQWGTVSVNSGAAVAVVFPLQFPNSCDNVTLGLQGNANTNTANISVAPTTTGFSVFVAGGSGANTVYWAAEGR